MVSSGAGSFAGSCSGVSGSPYSCGIDSDVEGSNSIMAADASRGKVGQSF